MVCLLIVRYKTCVVVRGTQSVRNTADCTCRLGTNPNIEERSVAAADSRMWLVITACLLAAAWQSCYSAQNSSILGVEYNLLRRLMARYTDEIPVTYPGEVVPIKMGLSLVSVQSLDPTKQTMTTLLYLRQSWTDPQLKWNPEDYSGVAAIRRDDVLQIWLPDIHFTNSMDTSYLDQVKPRIDYTGTVTFKRPLVLQTHCQLNLLHWPYDTQTCSLIFGSGIYASNEIQLELEDGDELISQDWFKPNNEFRVNATAGRVTEVQYSDKTQAFQRVEYTVELTRQTSYYTHLLIAPSVVTSLIIPVVFLLPTESKEKTIYGLGLLLAHILNFSQLKETFPANALPYVPFITVFFLANIILVCMTLVLSAIVSNIWKKGDHKRALPAPIRMVFLGVCGRVFCSSRDDYLPNDIIPTAARRLEMQAAGEEFEPASRAEQADMARTYSRLTNTAEWRQLAVVLDRLFFLVFSVIVLVMNCVYHF